MRCSSLIMCRCKLIMCHSNPGPDHALLRKANLIHNQVPSLSPHNHMYGTHSEVD